MAAVCDGPLLADSGGLREKKLLQRFIQQPDPEDQIPSVAAALPLD